MKNILVTGLAGFIGSKTAAQLAEMGYNVFGIDNLNDYYDVRIKHHRLGLLKKYDNIQFRQLDIENYEELFEHIKNSKVDAIINLAARAGVPYSMKNPFVYNSTNSTGTLNLLEAARHLGIRKIVLASTSSLYAGQKMPFSEDLPVNTPISPYAASKKAAEVMAYTYHFLFDLDVTILRYFTVYGTVGRPDMSIFRFIKWIDESKPLVLYGDGTQSRDFTYVEDIAAGSIKALKEVGYEIINLGGGQNPISLNTMIDTIEKHLGKKANIDFQPFVKTDMKETWADISKAKRLLDWEPTVSFDNGMKNTIEWHIENRDWIKDIVV
jgi:UDP-glucuronate 4-epimerase